MAKRTPKVPINTEPTPVNSDLEEVGVVDETGVQPPKRERDK